MAWYLGNAKQHIFQRFWRSTWVEIRSDKDMWMKSRNRSRRRRRRGKRKKCQCVIRLSIVESICFCFVPSFVLAAYLRFSYQTGFWKRRVRCAPPRSIDRPTERMCMLFSHTLIDVAEEKHLKTFWKDFYFGFTPAHSYWHGWGWAWEAGGEFVRCLHLYSARSTWIVATRDEIWSERGLVGEVAKSKWRWNHR